MKTRLRILNLIDIPWHSGLAAYAFDQAGALKARGHAVYFACPPESAAWEFAKRENIPAFPLPDRKAPFISLPFRALKRFIDREKITAINAHTGRAQSLAFILSLISAETPQIIRTKADAAPPSKSFSLARVSAIVAASDFIRQRYLKLGLSPQKVRLAAQAIDTPLTPLRTPEPPYKIGVLGRLDPVKGHDSFFKAASRLLERGTKAEFHVAGYEANIKYADLKAMSARLGLADAVIFHGRVADSLEFMASCDIGVIPSLGSEAVSRAALEWLAAGKPLVASSAGSLPEFAGPEYLFTPGDDAALASKLEALLEEPGQLTKIGASNRERAARQFSRQIFSEATGDIFENTAGGR